MSRIEDVLKKMQASGAAPLGEDRAERPIPLNHDAAPHAAYREPPVDPLSATGKRRKVIVEGDKHHIDPVRLVASGLLAPADRAPAIAEQFRRIKRPLIMNAFRDTGEVLPNRNVIMVASGLPGSGKSFCSVNLAVSLAYERELNILLVDGDIPKPHISRACGLEDAPGLTNLLFESNASVHDVLVRTDFHEIQLLPAGAQHAQATELLASERMSIIVKELSERYPDRLIVLDSPPLLITNEAQALADQVGQIALVVEAGRTTEQVLSQTLAMIDPAKAVNLILNKAPKAGKASYYYGDGYGYGYYGQQQQQRTA